MVNKTIYTKDVKGKIRFLTIQSETDGYIQISGIVGTPNPVTKFSAVKGKNIGKANETTPAEQAIKECEAKIKKKLSVDYFETIKEAETTEVILPMLAKVYEERIKFMNFDKKSYVCQPKLDGMRCLTFISNGVVKMISRDNVDITHKVAHIVKELSKLDDCILDGELYQHEIDFDTVMTKINTYRPGITEQIGYHLYDIVMDTDYIQRNNTLQGIISKYGLRHCHLVPYVSVQSHEQITFATDMHLNNQYEGSMVREVETPYEVSKRSNSLLKNKKFDDIQLEIIDVRPSEKNPNFGYPIYKWVGAENNELKSGIRMSEDRKIELLDNKDKYIGKVAEIRFFGYTSYGVPRFPVTVGIRLDKQKK